MTAYGFLRLTVRDMVGARVRWLLQAEKLAMILSNPINVRRIVMPRRDGVVSGVIEH